MALHSITCRAERPSALRHCSCNCFKSSTPFSPEGVVEYFNSVSYQAMNTKKMRRTGTDLPSSAPLYYQGIVQQLSLELSGRLSNLELLKLCSVKDPALTNQPTDRPINHSSAHPWHPHDDHTRNKNMTTIIIMYLLVSPPHAGNPFQLLRVTRYPRYPRVTVAVPGQIPAVSPRSLPPFSPSFHDKR